MDITKFAEMISGKPKDALLTILKNIRANDAPEHEDVVLQELDKRFPGWNTPKKPRVGGRTANRVIYKGTQRSFDTAKEGFSFLAAQMLNEGHRSTTTPDERLKIASTERRNYIAHSPEELFPGSPHLAEDSNNYVKMPHGWYLNVNLSNKDKFEVLARLSWVVGLKHLKDWDWIVDANTEDVLKRRERQQQVEELHAFFDDLLGDVLDGEPAS